MRDQKPKPPMPDRVIYFASALIIVVGIAVTWVLLATVGGSKDADRIEAIQTGVTIAIGVGGFFALFLAARRQQSTERSHELQERVAEATERDAADRRSVDLFTKAMEQFAHGEMHVRIGGLYALEQLAQAVPSYRQLVLNVICAYLRSEPEAALQSTDSAGQSTRSIPREWHERFAAQQIISAHFSPRDEKQFWADVRLDLSGARLLSPRFTECRFGDASFEGATFQGVALFRACDFRGQVTFADARFLGETFFVESKFAWRSVNFYRANFSSVVRFNAARFAVADFTGATFQGTAFFDDCHADALILSEARFDEGFRFPDEDFVDVRRSRVRASHVESLPSGWDHVIHGDGYVVVLRHGE